MGGNCISNFYINKGLKQWDDRCIHYFKCKSIEPWKHGETNVTVWELQLAININQILLFADDQIILVEKNINYVEFITRKIFKENEKIK